MRRLCILALFVVQAWAGAPSLHDAAKRGDEEQLEALLNGGAEVDARDENGCTPLHKAAGEGHLQAAKLLLNGSADVDARCNNNGATPLHIAAWNGHQQAAKLLLDSGAQVNAQAENDWTPLHMVAWQGHLQAAKLLLDHGAEVDARSNNGATPLGNAAFNGRLQIAKLLLDRGADVNARGKTGWTPLHMVGFQGHVQVGELLLDRGAEVDVQEDQGWTPLHRAVWNGHERVLELLLHEGGADRAIRDHAGLMARDLALANRAKNSSKAELMSRVLLPLTPQEEYAILTQRVQFWFFIVASVFGVLAAVLWEQPDVTLKHKVYDALRFQLRPGDRAEGPSRGAIVLAAGARAKNQRLAKAFRLAEVFCNIVVPMRMMIAFNPWAWLSVLAVAYLLPEYLLTGSRLPPQPFAIVVASARQSLLGDAGSWSKRTWAFLAIGAARSILMVAIFWVVAVNDTRDWWEQPQPWFKNVKGQEAVWLLHANDEEYKAGLPFGQLTIPSVSQQWAWVNLGGLAVLAGWLIAVVFTLCLRRPTQATPHHLLSSEPQKGVLDLAAEVDQACERLLEIDGDVASTCCWTCCWTGVTYEHLLEIDGNLEPFGLITCLPPGGLIFEVGLIFVDIALDMFSVNTMLLNEEISFAGIIFVVSVVSSARQLARGALVKLCKDAKVMTKTGVRTEVFMELCDEESGAEAFVSLLVSAYALPFSVRTPMQTVLGCLSMVWSVWRVATLLHELLDLEELAAEERAALLAAEAAKKDGALQPHSLLATEGRRLWRVEGGGFPVE